MYNEKITNIDGIISLLMSYTSLILSICKPRFLSYFTNSICKNVGFGRKLDIRKSPQVFADSEDFL